MKFCKIIFSFSLLFVLQTSVYSQVGIGNTNPDASSILDMTSTTQGVLTPRMTTAQRIVITTPAEGLLVFDTDEDAFYFYDGIQWTPIERRDNYKLVKDISDLADELVAGGGTTYLLDENYLYEINGTVTFDFPVDLNGANIAGRDTGEDILVNASGAALFSGANGGRIRDVLINGGGQQIFDITSDGVQSMVGYSIVITNASSLGTLSDLFAVFFEVLQVVNSNDGLDVSNITSFFVDKIFWTDSNTGTFLTLSGTFGNLQIANGRVVADAGEVGIDVSANPIISVSASLMTLDFTGVGTLINKYTTGSYIGYNFTNDWHVDCPGIPLESDDSTTGYYYMDDGNTTTTTFVTDGVPVKVAGATTSNGLFRTSATDNNLVYEGKEAREFQMICTGALDHGTTATPNARVYEFFLYKTPNGGSPAVVSGLSSGRRFSNNDIGNFSMVGLVNLEPGDAIEIYVSVEDTNTSVNRAADVNTFFTRLNVVLK